MSVQDFPNIEKHKIGRVTDDNYHGTAKGTSDSIQKIGWKISITGRHGLGIYFANDFDFAKKFPTEYEGKREILKCRVAWGKRIEWKKIRNIFNKWYKNITVISKYEYRTKRDFRTIWLLSKGFDSLIIQHQSGAEIRLLSYYPIEGEEY